MQNPFENLRPETISKLLKILPLPLALCDKNKNIFWENNEFAECFNSDKKRKDFATILKSLDVDNSTEFNCNNSKAAVKLFPLGKDIELEGYLVLLNLNKKSNSMNDIQNKIRGAAHDLNNILNNIINSVDMLNQKLSDNTDVDYLLSNITKNSNRAIDLTSQLLGSKAPHISSKRSINAKTLVTELCNSFKLTAPNLSLETNLDKDISGIYGNYSELYSALLNLCVNSMEALSGTGKIIISAHNVLSNNGQKGSSKKYVLIEVSDNGSGIEESNLENIFSNNFSTKNKTYSSGLGLFNVKKIISEHDGFIEVKSEVNVGTTFKIYLPVEEKPDIDPDKAKDKTILIAEDEEPLRRLLSDLFTSYDYNVATAENGIDALEIINKGNKIDLLIIDKKMPGMDGVECVKQIRESGYGFPIILATGSFEDGDTDYDKNLIDKFLVKPYSFEKILSMVNKLI